MWRPPSMRKSLLWSVIGSLSFACAPASELELYRLRVSQALDRDVPLDYERIEAYPRQRDLRVPIVRDDIGIIAFAELHQCDLGGLVGGRNSGLGRFAGASQRLAYEIRFLDAAATCELEWVQDLRRQKQSRLPALLWNAIFAGPELTGAFAARQHEGGRQAGAIVSAGPLEALRLTVDAILQGDLNLDVRAFEETLFELKRQAYGERRHRWTALRRTLNAVSRVLRTSRVCLNDSPTPRSRRLAAVFVRHYVEGVQAVAARMQREDRDWLEALARLYDALAPSAPPAYADFHRSVVAYHAPRSEWARTQAAFREHAGAWQTVFEACGLRMSDVVTSARIEVR